MEIPLPWWAYNLNNTGAMTLGAIPSPVPLTPYGLDGVSGKYGGGATATGNAFASGATYDSFASYIEGDFTASAWVEIITSPPESFEFDATHSTAGFLQLELSYAGGSNRRFSTYPPGDQSANIAFSLGWHHIAFVREGTTVRCYKDGVLAATLTGVSNGAANGYSGYAIGNSQSAAFFDEIATWKVALTGAEVAAVYAAEIANWDIAEESSGSSASSASSGSSGSSGSSDSSSSSSSSSIYADRGMFPGDSAWTARGPAVSSWASQGPGRATFTPRVTG